MYRIEITDAIGAMLVAQARKRNLPVSEYVRKVLKLALVADAVQTKGGRIIIEDRKGTRELIF